MRGGSTVLERPQGEGIAHWSPEARAPLPNRVAQEAEVGGVGTWEPEWRGGELHLGLTQVQKSGKNGGPTATWPGYLGGLTGSAVDHVFRIN